MFDQSLNIAPADLMLPEFFPLLERHGAHAYGCSLRQPIYASDVEKVCAVAIGNVLENNRVCDIVADVLGGWASI